jgi:hypothetical protein
LRDDRAKNIVFAVLLQNKSSSAPKIVIYRIFFCFNFSEQFLV